MEPTGITRSASYAEWVRRRGFWIVAATLTLFLFGASAPAPLYAVYQQRYGFSATVLTAIFAMAGASSGSSL